MSRITQQLQQSTALTPAEHERRKTAQQRAEDFMYTVNHAVTCLSLTDFLIAPFFSTVFGWNICGHHDHGKDGGSHGSSGGSHSAGGGHSNHYPGCGHWPTSSISGATASPSSSTAASTSSSGASATSPAKAAPSRIGSGMRFTRPFWKASPPAATAKSSRARGLFTGLSDAAADVGESGANLGKKMIDLCADPDCTIPEHQSDFMGPPRYEKTAEFVGPPKPDHLKTTTNPTPSFSGHYYGSGSSSAPAKLTLRERAAAWWNELRASPIAYLKKHYPGFKQWVIGEAVGDIGAVPVTLAVQHFAPGVMQGIQRAAEPIIGGIMRRRARSAAEHWADKHNIARDSDEIVTRAQELYNYEIRHLPQMAMWTLSSVAINYGVMKFMSPSMGLATFAKGKAVGAGITAALVFGARTLVPDKAHKWDETMGRRVVVPITKAIGRLGGVDSKTVEEHAAKQKAGTWAEHVTQKNEKSLAVGG